MRLEALAAFDQMSQHYRPSSPTCNLQTLVRIVVCARKLEAGNSECMIAEGVIKNI